MRICPLAFPIDGRWRQCQATDPGAMLVRTPAAAIAPAGDRLLRPGVNPGQGDVMAHRDQLILSTAAFGNLIDKKHGKPHVAERVDRWRIRVIPEWSGAGALR